MSKGSPPAEKLVSAWKMTPFPDNTSIGDPQSIAIEPFVLALRGVTLIAETVALPPFVPLKSIRSRPFATAAAVVRLNEVGV